MKSGVVRLAGRCLGAAVVAVAPSAGYAQTVQTGVLVSAGVSAESNPYNSVTSPDVGVAATAEIRPQWTLREEGTAITVDGLAQFRQFFSDYGLEDNYGVNASLQSRRSEQVTVRANALFSYNEGGFNGFGRPSLSPVTLTPDVITGGQTGATLPLPEPLLNAPLPLLTDVTVLGQRTRTTLFGAGVGLDLRLDGRSSVSADANVRGARFALAGFGDYNSAGGELRYSRSISELTSVGVIGGGSYTDYLGTRSGDTATYFGLLSLDRRFNARWAVSIAAGVSRSDIRQLAGLPNTSLTAFNIRGQFCRTDERSRLCISGNRSPQPAANGNVRISDSVVADYSLRVSPRERISLAGSYTRTGRGEGVAAALPAAEFAGASARYDNQLNQRATLFATASVSKIFGGFASGRANVGAALGVQFGFGAMR